MIVVRFASDGSERKLMADYAPMRKVALSGRPVIDGKAVAARVRERVAAEVAEFDRRVGRAPGPGDGAGRRRPRLRRSTSRNKRKACEEAGIRSIHHELPADISQEELLALVGRARTRDDEVDGILVQLPLPDGLDQDAVVAAIDPARTSTA